MICIIILQRQWCSTEKKMICKISCKIFVLTVEYRFPSWYSKTISIWPFFTFSFMFSDNVVHCILNPCRKMKQGLQIFVHYAFPFNSLITTCPFFALHILLSQGHCLSELLKRLQWWFCSFGLFFNLIIEICGESFAFFRMGYAG